ncbi:MAG: hypothetical protein WBB74_12225 [Gaiellaceae bacterium]
MSARELYRAGVVGFAVLFIGLGIALIAVTATRGGGVGYLLGALFVALGFGRLFLIRRR